MFRYSLIVFLLCILCITPTVVTAATAHPEPYLEKEEIRHIVENTVAALSQEYLFAEQTDKVKARLQHELTSGEFTRGYHFGQFRQKFESILVNGTSDTGFELLERRQMSALHREPLPAEDNAIDSELLSENIGYIKLQGDFVKADRRSDLVDTLSTLRDVDALIIDLRDAGAASMDFAQQLVSPFLQPGTLMGTVSFNDQHEPVELLADPAPELSAFAGKTPVYILTSGFVSGPWEFVSYTLKHHDAAVIVGDDTMGMSYMKKTIPVSNHAELTLYYAQITHPLTQDNWQYTGVFADYQVKAEDSLETALKLARDQSGEQALR
ncbi:S41 family peptidase [Alteromonas sp. H39]|uniref:S41 family peptidase n=1 Tax=Alteromonas sp. H39 TaxID=3389876 RepID=UPI0039E12268